MTELHEFLLARVAEDEACLPDTNLSPEWRTWVALECAAKRRIVAELESMNRSALHDDPDLSMAAAHTSQGLFYAVCALACAYAHHQDYRQEWAL